MSNSMVHLFKDGARPSGELGFAMTHSAAIEVLRELHEGGADLERWDMVYLENGRFASWAL